MPELRLYSEYSRQEVHDILSPNTRFTPSSGTWGLHGIIEISDKPGDFVFFVTFGQHQGEHIFDEWITEEGVISWQSQPRQSFKDRRIQQFIYHDDRKNSIHLFLRTQRIENYTYLGKLKYLTHDPVHEKPVYMYWQLLDWPIPVGIISKINLRLEPANVFQLGRFRIMEPEQDHDHGKMIFEWRGMTWQVNYQALILQVRDWITRGLPDEATRFKDWFVEIDGQRISPKWLFHLITGAGYNEFDAPLAREKLWKVGLKAVRFHTAEDTDSTNRGNLTPVNLLRLKPEERHVLFQTITQKLSQEFPQTFIAAKYRFPDRENWFEIHFPNLKGYYSLRLARQFDEFAYFFPGNTKVAVTFAQQLTPHLKGFSEQMDYPVAATPNYTRTWGRLGIEIPPGIVCKYDEQDEPAATYARLLGRFVQVTYHLLIGLQAPRTNIQPNDKKNLLKCDQSHVKLLVARLDAIRQVLNGSMATPSDEVLCDWVHFCYDFGLFEEGQMLFTFVTTDQVNPWYYERTKKIARLCSIRTAPKE